MFDPLRRFVTKFDSDSPFTHEFNFSSRKKRFCRFLFAGGINTLFGFVVYSLFILAGVTVWFSLLASTLLGTIFNFFTTGGYVFRQFSASHIPRFAVCYLIIYGLNFILIELVSLWLSSKITAQAILVFPMAVLSYFLMGRFVFVSR